MNKKKLLNALSQKTGMTNQEAKKAVEAFVEIVTETLASDGKVQMGGFGTFETASRSARTGRNPRTGEPIEVAASRSPVFKAGKALKDAVKK